MYCIKCGAKVRDGYNFCTNCGESMNYNDNSTNNAIIGEYNPTVKEKVIKVKNEEEKPLAKEGLIIGLVFCVLVASIASIFIVSYYARDFEPKYYEKEI